jgi:hypothetical protein
MPPRGKGGGSRSTGAARGFEYTAFL